MTKRKKTVLLGQVPVEEPRLTVPKYLQDLAGALAPPPTDTCVVCGRVHERVMVQDTGRGQYLLRWDRPEDLDEAFDRRRYFVKQWNDATGRVHVCKGACRDAFDVVQQLAPDEEMVVIACPSCGQTDRLSMNPYHVATCAACHVEMEVQ